MRRAALASALVLAGCSGGDDEPTGRQDPAPPVLGSGDVQLSPQAADRLQSVEIIKSARAMDKASDHVPIVATLG